MEYTVIILGRLEFANTRSIQQATKVIAHLLETRYKNDVRYKEANELLNEETCSLTVPREKFTSSEKMWTNTLHMLSKAAEFSIAGDINMWKVLDGELQDYQCIEPNSDKTTVQAFREGRDLLVDGKLDAAKEKLSLAIKRFPRHAQALERRGFIYYLQGDTAKAMADYAASMTADSKRPDAYLGRAKIYIDQENWSAALDDLTQSMKHSMPHHNVYLEALHRKGRCQMEMGENSKAIASFNFFLTRPLLEDHPQFIFRRQVTFDKGRALSADGKMDEAIKCFDEALSLPTRDGNNLLQAEILLHRGIAMQKSGKKGFKENWKQAANEGSKRAAELLAEVA
jgi:tetratricopeptide (TPR) repeat protein